MRRLEAVRSTATCMVNGRSAIQFRLNLPNAAPKLLSVRVREERSCALDSLSMGHHSDPKP